MHTRRSLATLEDSSPTRTQIPEMFAEIKDLLALVTPPSPLQTPSLKNRLTSVQSERGLVQGGSHDRSAMGSVDTVHPPVDQTAANWLVII